MKKAHVISLLTLATLSFAMSSCVDETDLYDCRGNCVDVNITGKLYVKTDGTPVPNTPITVLWYHRRDPWSTKYRIATGNSKSDGTFSFNATIDSSFFKDYYVCIRTQVGDNYLPLDYKDDNLGEKEIYAVNINDLQNIKVEFYHKVDLTIHVLKTLNDTVSILGIEHGFDTDLHSISYIDYASYLDGSDSQMLNKLFAVKTASDIHTTIRWVKNYRSQLPSYSVVRYFGKDSIVCTKNGKNVFVINY
jgi:hypothetical protein